MAGDPNALRWDGGPGHYEVYYLTVTDRASGVGLWVRYTMLAPSATHAGGADGLPSTTHRRGDGVPSTTHAGDAGTSADPAQPSCSLWFAAMHPRDGVLAARKAALAISDLTAGERPFHLRIGTAELADHGMSGALDDARWDLRWEPSLAPAEHVHRLLRAARAPSTVLVLPHPDLAVSGTVAFGGRELRLEGARGAQAHLWGSKHASRWTWAHCNDFESLEGEARPECYLDAVSAVVSRLGREVGPSTPVVGRFGGRDFRSTRPLEIVRNRSRFGLTSWRLEATDGGRRVVADVQADRAAMVGVTYRDPDGELAYCYNGETASMRVRVWEGDRLVEELAAPGRAHFEYGQREPVPGMPRQVT